MPREGAPALYGATYTGFVIALAVAIAAMAAIISGMFLDHWMQWDHSWRVREDADVVRSMRDREDIHATHRWGAISVESLWGHDTHITGIVVVCEGGAIRTGEADHTIPAGTVQTLDIIDTADTIRGACP